MLSFEQIFERLQWGYNFNLKKGDRRFSLKNEDFLSASCFGRNGYVFIHFHQNEVYPQLSSINVTIYDRRYNTESRLKANKSNYLEIKKQINAVLA